jgi:nucleotide-binding universal stress UspA family protein
MNGPVLIAYDGSDLAKEAIAGASRQLAPGRDAVVLTVWQPADVGFIAPPQLTVKALAARDVKTAAEQVAADGASLAEAAGFKARGMEREAAPAWDGIVKVGDELDASLIVIGHHSRRGMAGVLIGSVAAGVANHSDRSLLVVHLRDD